MRNFKVMNVLEIRTLELNMNKYFFKASGFIAVLHEEFCADLFGFSSSLFEQ